MCLDKMCKIISVSVLLVLLAACTTTSGPVVIRYTRSVVDTSNEATVAIAQPVVPEKQQSSIPLIERLAVQSNQALNDKEYNNAINLAERGLRINRKESRFYLVLSKAYRWLENQKQSVYFAKQGLRYTQKQHSIYSELKRLSQQ